MLQTIMKLIYFRVKNVLDLATLSLDGDKYKIFRKKVLDEFGQSGLEKDLERVLQDKERQGSGRNTLSKEGV
jgi:hypothetical protein